MKKNVIVFCLFLLITGFASAQAVKGGTMYVSVKTLSLKSSTGFFASTKGTLNYGDKVTILQINGKNAEVRSSSNSSVTGWTTTANLSAKQVVAGSTNTASAKEVALAGKGFNQEVENAYKTKGKANYADVDRVERNTVSDADLQIFLEDGRLAMGE